MLENHSTNVMSHHKGKERKAVGNRDCPRIMKIKYSNLGEQHFGSR